MDSSDYEDSDHQPDQTDVPPDIDPPLGENPSVSTLLQRIHVLTERAYDRKRLVSQHHARIEAGRQVARGLRRTIRELRDARADQDSLIERLQNIDSQRIEALEAMLVEVVGDCDRDTLRTMILEALEMDIPPLPRRRRARTRGVRCSSMRRTVTFADLFDRSGALTWNSISLRAGLFGAIG